MNARWADWAKNWGLEEPKPTPKKPTVKPVSVGKPQEDRSKVANLFKVANLLRTAASFGEAGLVGMGKGIADVGALVRNVQEYGLLAPLAQRGFEVFSLPTRD